MVARYAVPVGANDVTAATKRRIDALEGAKTRFAPLPEIVPDTTTDAELMALRCRGVDAYRESDPGFVDLFL